MCVKPSKVEELQHWCLKRWSSFNPQWQTCMCMCKLLYVVTWCTYSTATCHQAAAAQNLKHGLRFSPIWIAYLPRSLQSWLVTSTRIWVDSKGSSIPVALCMVNNGSSCRDQQIVRGDYFGVRCLQGGCMFSMGAACYPHTHVQLLSMVT